MRNPYEVLEISEGASMETITKAYREMVKKYHPDRYGDNPLKDLAEEKLREINEAYDILKQRASSSNSSYSNNNHSNRNSSTYSSPNNNTRYSDLDFYNEVRMNIQTRNYSLALQRLNDWNNRDAEWHFLMGVCHLNKGWYDTGMNFLTKAIDLNPSNMEYKSTYDRFVSHNNNYRQNYSYRNHGHRGFCGNDDCCDMFCKLWALDTMCECMGGDCIDCM